MENYSIDQLYPKIEGPYERDRSVKHGKPVHGAWREPWMRCLAGAEWDFYEKIDGMNIRVIWDGQNVQFKGRTDAAVLPGPLQTRLGEMFTSEILREWSPMVLFGEGYGAKIQSGGDYSPTQEFILFDIFTGRGWVDSKSSYYREVVDHLHIKEVPYVGTGTLRQGMDLVWGGIVSSLAQKSRRAEGLVARLTDASIRVGTARPILKIKSVDFFQEGITSMER